MDQGAIQSELISVAGTNDDDSSSTIAALSDVDETRDLDEDEAPDVDEADDPSPVAEKASDESSGDSSSKVDSSSTSDDSSEVSSDDDDEIARESSPPPMHPRLTGLSSELNQILEGAADSRAGAGPSTMRECRKAENVATATSQRRVSCLPRYVLSVGCAVCVFSLSRDARPVFIYRGRGSYHKPVVFA